MMSEGDTHEADRNSSTCVVALAATNVSPAATIVNTQLNGNLLNNFSGPGTLEIDTAFLNRGSHRADRHARARCDATFV
jgi:hypothetical protein